MCGLIATSVGIIANVSGLFFTPVAEEFQVLKGSVSMTLTIANLCFALGGLAAPKLIREETLKQVLIIGTACIAGSTALLGLSGNLWMMYVLNAVRGFAGGILGFVLVTMVINNWFYKSTGLMTSIAMSFSGLTGALCSPLLASVIEHAGWRIGYLIAALMTVLFNLPSILFLPSIDPGRSGMKPYGDTETHTSGEIGASKKSSSEVSSGLLSVVVLFAFMACGVTALPQHFPGIASSYGLNASTGAYMLSVSMAANTFGKMIFGAMADRFGTKLSMLIYSVLTIAGILLIQLIHTPAVLYVGAGLVGLTYALGAVAVVMLTKDMFGLENYSRTYPVTSLAGAVGNALLASMIGFMYDFSGDYRSTLFLMLAMLTINTLIILTVYRGRKKTVHNVRPE